MKFPRNARFLTSQLDAAALASVFFLLVIFVLLASLVYTPGVYMPIEMPRADGFSGTEGPTIAVAVDAGGQFYFEHQLIREEDLGRRLQTVATNSPQRVTLVVLADQAVRAETWVRLLSLATKAGMEAKLAVLPLTVDNTASPPR